MLDMRHPDVLNDWIRTATRTDTVKMERSEKLYRSWCDWCAERQEIPGSHRAFSFALAKRFNRTRISSGSVFRGIEVMDVQKPRTARNPLAATIPQSEAINMRAGIPATRIVMVDGRLIPKWD